MLEKKRNIRSACLLMICLLCVSANTAYAKTYTIGQRVSFNAYDIQVGGAISRQEYLDSSSEDREKVLSASNKKKSNAEKAAEKFNGKDRNGAEDGSSTKTRKLSAEDAKKFLGQVGLSDEEIEKALGSKSNKSQKETWNADIDPDVLGNVRDFFQDLQNPAQLSREEAVDYARKNGLSLGHMLKAVSSAFANTFSDRYGDIDGDPSSWSSEDWKKFFAAFSEDVSDAAGIIDESPSDIELSPGTEAYVPYNIYSDVSEYTLAGFDADTGEAYSTDGRKIVCSLCGEAMTAYNANFEYRELDMNGWVIDETGKWSCMNCMTAGGLPGKYTGNDIISQDPDAQQNPNYNPNYATELNKMTVPELYKQFYDGAVFNDEMMYNEKETQMVVVLKDSGYTLVDELKDKLSFYMEREQNHQDVEDASRQNQNSVSGNPDAWTAEDMEKIRDAILEYYDDVAEEYNGGFPQNGNRNTWNLEDFSDDKDSIFMKISGWSDDKSTWTPEMESKYDQWADQYAGTQTVKWLKENEYFDPGTNSLSMIDGLIKDYENFSGGEDTVSVKLITRYSNTSASKDSSSQLVIGYYQYRIVNSAGKDVITPVTYWPGGTRIFPCYAIGTYTIIRTPVIFNISKVNYSSDVTYEWYVEDKLIQTINTTVTSISIDGFNASTRVDISSLNTSAFNITFTVVAGDFGDLSITTGYDTERIQ